MQPDATNSTKTAAAIHFIVLPSKDLFGPDCTNRQAVFAGGTKDTNSIVAIKEYRSNDRRDGNHRKAHCSGKCKNER